MRHRLAVGIAMLQRVGNASGTCPAASAVIIARVRVGFSASGL